MSQVAFLRSSTRLPQRLLLARLTYFEFSRKIGLAQGFVPV